MAVEGRELSTYTRIPRGPQQPEGFICTQEGYPAIQYALADVLGYQSLSAAADLEVGSWYFLNTAAATFTVTLPTLDTVNEGDAVGFATDGNALVRSASIAVGQSGEMIQAGAVLGATLICNSPNDRFRLVKAEGKWNAV
jgi:hypothetical protein